jgi:outer membrane lipoprotein-sorting protein
VTVIELTDTRLGAAVDAREFKFVAPPHTDHIKAE